ncbi:hypothetical protein WICPIJ_008120 [Wickerhamomyces pijperi]|uniref:Aminopeptidase n=1 Tax=Wickerhamomyces pijperi TaxID=599730 RepID=A0A9P8PYM1_WICPI|nr:hypothetical protein WICPIJ_008120 [Wickerhamomyces pijperi]
MCGYWTIFDLLTVQLDGSQSTARKKKNFNEFMSLRNLFRRFTVLPSTKLLPALTPFRSNYKPYCTMVSASERDVLPSYFKPVHYDLEVFNINVQQNTFQGKVNIELNIKEDTNKIVLNSHGLTFQNTTVKYTASKTEQNIQVQGVEFEEKKDLATISLSETLKASPDAKVSLTIDYTAAIRTNMEGFYRSDYKDLHGKDQVLLSTQFEAIAARSAFPCFDEPNLKASYQLTLTVAEDFTAISNTPIVSSTILGDGKKKGPIEAHGLKKVKFEKTVVQSSYLFAWVVGKLDYVEAFTERTYNGKRLPVRVYTQEGFSDQGLFGLEVAKQAVDVLSDVFEIDYVLPKLDLVAVPAYSHNAMENWGLITFRPTALLFDPKSSSEEYKAKVCSVVCHELAHQWFGNLVTMDWWDELWLNEGFATWVGTYVVGEVYPEWRAFEIDIFESQVKALESDSVRSSHPVEVPIQSASDIDQVFDQISYLKGCSVIHQIAQTLGTKTFLQGVAHYLKKNKFSNGTLDDLLSSISEVSGKNVLEISNNWIRKIGFPYVTVQVLDNGDVKFTQKRFLSAGDATESEDQTLWSIPLQISTGIEDSDLKTFTLNQRELVIPQLAIEAPFFKVNKNKSGFYRVVYDEKSRTAIESNTSKLSNVDKADLINDSFVTSIAGLSKTSDFLSLLKSFKGESDYLVLVTIVNALKKFKSLWYTQSPEIQLGLNEFFKSIISSPSLSFLENEASSDFLTNNLRIDLLNAGSSFGIEEIIANGRAKFDTLLSNGEADPSLRLFILSSVIASPTFTLEQFESVIEYIQTSKALDTREIALTALSSVTNPDLIPKAFSLILDERIPIMDVQFIAIGLSKNTKTKSAFWKYLHDNYDAIYNRLNLNKVVFDRFIKFTLGNLSCNDTHDEIMKFFEDKDIYGFERSLGQILDQIKTNSAWIERDSKDVEAWLNANK